MANLNELMSSIAEAIRHKRNITDRINAQDFPNEIEKITSGGGSVELLKPVYAEGNGPVPNTGHLDKIFFNTKLTTDQVDSIIANAHLPFLQVDVDRGFYFLVAGGTTALLIVDMGTQITDLEKKYKWAIVDMNSETTYYASPLISNMPGFSSGWNQDAFTSFETGEVAINADLLAGQGDIEVGTHNELLTELVYSNSEIVDTGKFEIAKTLTDQYKLIEKNLKLDTGVNNTYTYDFIDNINEDTKEISIIKNIQIKSKENDIIQKTLMTYTNNDATEIRDYLFYKCEILTDINFPQTVKIYEKAFYQCTTLVNINIPLVKDIRDSAFGFCNSLENINLPEVTSIGNGIFLGCKSLKNITAPLLKIINQNTFNGCNALKNVNFPKVTTLNSRAFYDCFQLTEVILPEVTTIYTEAFANCYNLVKLFISQKDKICSIASDSFLWCYHILGTQDSTDNPQGLKDGYIYVPASLLSQYKVKSNWSTYATQIIGHEDLEAGATLPNYTTDSFTTQTWYSDEKLITPVTEVATSGTYYCRLEA